MSVFIDACLGLPTPYTPIWLMRQAGRYLPEYKQVRQQAGSFLNLLKNVELATQVTLQPITRFGMDAAIVFSDILTVPDALGSGLEFIENVGPILQQPIRTVLQIHQLPPFDMEKLSYVSATIQKTRAELDPSVPLIGFSGSPWTLACYMVEGRGSSDFRLTKQFMYSEPQAFEQLLQRISDAVVEYLNAQIRAGAQAVMLFDSWGGILADGMYQRFSLNFIRQILSRVLTVNARNEPIPTLVFSRMAGIWLPELASLPCRVLAVDWQVNIRSTLRLLKQLNPSKPKTLQGNLDPMALFSSPEEVQRQAKAILDQVSYDSDGWVNPPPNFIFNLGHGIHQLTPIDHVSTLVETVHAYSKSLKETFAQRS